MQESSIGRAQTPRHFALRTPIRRKAFYEDPIYDQIRDSLGRLAESLRTQVRSLLTVQNVGVEVDDDEFPRHFRAATMHLLGGVVPVFNGFNGPWNDGYERNRCRVEAIDLSQPERNPTRASQHATLNGARERTVLCRFRIQCQEHVTV
jgi:hypothetical protein